MKSKLLVRDVGQK